MKRFISAILVTIIALISLSGCLGKGGDYVAEIGNTKISRGEFMVYLIEQKKNFEEQGGSDIWEADFDGVSAIEVAKQNALDSITMVKSAVKQTDSLGIKLDEKDISDIDNQTKSLMSEFSSEELTELSLDYDKIHSILEESALQSKVYDYVTSNYVVNSDEMNKYIEEYKKKNAGEFNMTDADIVRAPFFKHHINEIIGNRVGMVVALVQLYLFLRTPAVDAGGKCKLHTTEQEQCKHRKRRGEKVIPAAVGQKKQTEQEKQGIENREQGSDQRMNDNELVTHISRSHGGDVGAPDGIHRLCFFEFLNSSSILFLPYFYFFIEYLQFGNQYLRLNWIACYFVRVEIGYPIYAGKVNNPIVIYLTGFH